jgi:predicted transglutaminase-like cysteine proteinase
MQIRTAATGFFTAILLGALANTAHAFSANMMTLGRTNPPIGHYQFCQQYPNQCQSNGSDTGPLQLTEARWKAILQVNYRVNSTIEPETDQEIYGVEEKWAYPDKVGDCEDYVLLKRKMLMDKGFSPADLLITVVLQPNGDGHAILTVRTDRGDFVLDNMRNKVLLWSDTEYTYLKRQSVKNSGQWVKIEDDHSPAVGSID